MSTTLLIVGSGPTGLTLACLLAQYGVNVRIIDKRIESITTSNALAVHARTLEIFECIGIVDAAIKRGIRLQRANLYSGDQLLAKLKFDQLQTRYPFVLGLAQHDTEALLTEKLRTLGVDIERGVECIAWQARGQKIEVTLKSAHHAAQIETIDWLCDCAGAHDHLREKLKLQCVGQNLPQQFIMADVKVDGPLKLDAFHVFFSPFGPLAMIPFGNQGLVRVLAEISHDDVLSTKPEIVLADFDAIIEQRSQLKVKLTDPRWLTKFSIHSRFYAPYRHGHFLLLGDSVHHHSPVGGQGMNTGMQDTFNLAWKLALVVKGHADSSLLASYAQEREPVGKRLVKSTAVMTRIVAIHQRLLQIVRNKIFTLALKRPNMRQNVINQLAELCINYRHSPWVLEGLAKHSGPKAGERMPDIELTLVKGGTKRLYHCQTGYKHLLVVFTTASLKKIDATELETLQAWCAQYTQDTIDMVVAQLPSNTDDFGQSACCYLIRPDLMVGARWASFALEPLCQYVQKALSI